MAYLERYEKFPECYRKKAYELAWLICPYSQIVEERIIPEAVDYVFKSARRNGKRLSRITFTDLQLFQIGLLKAEEQVPLTRDRAWIRYIIHLASYTVPHSSFDVIVGFGSILSNGSTKECVTLYNYLDPSVEGEKAGGQRIPLDGERYFKAIQQQMYTRFEKDFETHGQELDLQETPKHVGDKIHEILKHILLWETRHVPDTYGAYCADCDKQKKLKGEARLVDLERTRAHIGIDQEQCLEHIKSWHGQLRGTFNTWQLPHLRLALPNVPNTNPSQDDPPPDDDPWRPPDMSHWDEIDKRIQKEILWKEHEEKTKAKEEKAKQKNAKKNRGQASAFEVVVDGTVTALLTRRERSASKISLPASARYVEIRDRGSRTTVANCHLMDPHDLPEKGWKSAVKLFSGEKVYFAFFPEPKTPELGRDDEEICLSMRVRLKASPWQSLTVVADLLKEGGRRLAELIRVPAFSFATLVLAFVLGAVGNWAVSRFTIPAQYDEWTQQVHCNDPSGVCFSVVDQRFLQLVLSPHRRNISEARVYWGDNSDPLRGTQISPGVPIKHEYRPVPSVPPEGVTTIVRTLIVPAGFKGERPKSLFAPIGLSSETNVSSSRRLWLRPDRIVLDPPDDSPEVQVVSPYQSQRGELVESRVQQKLDDAQGYLESGSPNGGTEAVRLYQEVLEQLSTHVRQQLNQELLEAASQDVQAGYIDQAARKYRAVFSAY